jgi:hypothetical protein
LSSATRSARGRTLARANEDAARGWSEAVLIMARCIAMT